MIFTKTLNVFIPIVHDFIYLTHYSQTYYYSGYKLTILINVDFIFLLAIRMYMVTVYDLSLLRRSLNVLFSSIKNIMASSLLRTKNKGYRVFYLV